MQVSQEYSSYLKEQMKRLETQEIIITDTVNFRLVEGLSTDFEQLKVMMEYVKETPKCEPCVNPLKRIIPELRIQLAKPEDQLNSQLVAVNAAYTKEVKQLCDSMHITSLIVKPADIRQLEGVEKSQVKSKMTEFFSRFQVYICSSTILAGIKKLIDTKYVYKHANDEVDALRQVYMQIKRLKTQQVDPQLLHAQLSAIAARLPDFIDNYTHMNKFHLYGGSRIYDATGLYFQRTIYLKTHSSKCKILIPSKCCWILNYQPNTPIPVPEVERAYTATTRLAFLTIHLVQKHVQINTTQFQLTQFIKKYLPRFMLPQQPNPLNSIKLFHQMEQEMFNHIPLKGVTDPVAIPMMIHQMPFKMYNTADTDSVQLAVNGFTSANATADIRRRLEINPLNLVTLIRQKHQEVCPLCFNDSTQFFTFACCGCSISLDCFNYLISEYQIKCPNCRYVLNFINTWAGAFFLNQFFKFSVNVTPDRLHNTTIIIADKVTRFGIFKSNDTIHNIIIKPTSSASQTTAIKHIYNAVLETPSHLKIQIFLNGTNQQIIHLASQLVISPLNE